MPEETQPQAELEPGEVTATPTEDVTVTKPQAIDYAALEERAQGLGDGYSLSNLADKYEDARRGLNDAQRKSIETERRYEPVKPLIDMLQQNPEFAAHMQNAAKDWFGRGEYGGDVDVPPEVKTSLDPVYNRVANLEDKLAGNEMDQEVERLKASGMPIDETVKNQIYQRIIDTNGRGSDVSAHAWEILGPTMVENAGKQATQDVTEKIKSNNKKYVDVPGGAPSESSVDIAQMSKGEFDDAVFKELEERMVS